MNSPAQTRDPRLVAPGDSARPRLDSLTGLRWFAALAVFVTHVGVLLPVPHLRGLFALGSSGVTFFFVLSGFVLTWTYDPGDRVGGFYGRRFARIWPMLVIGVLLPLLLQLPDAPKGQTRTLVLIAISAVLVYQAWIPNWILGGTTPVTWSVSCEAFFYALFPFLVRFALRRSRAWLAWAAVLLVVVGWGIRAWLWAAYPPVARPRFTGMEGLIFGTYSPIARLWEFLLGVVAAAAIRRGWRSPLSVPVSTTVLAAGMAVLWLLRGEVWRHFVAFDVLGQATAPLYALLVVSVATRDLAGGSSWLGSKPLIALGEWSYAFYLLHFTVLYEISSSVFDRKDLASFYLRPVRASWSNGGWALLAVVVTVAASGLLYLAFERPAERWLRARIGRRGTSSSSAFDNKPQVQGG
ncbi:acyltransferase family protein [Kitasatospora sp. NPDC056531]|uniref:acyltransferase family protein n=1 Tax=Kitasatospora sp. NPDC056531 TaxID=3345856 RepID=UPI0036854B39